MRVAIAETEANGYLTWNLTEAETCVDASASQSTISNTHHGRFVLHRHRSCSKSNLALVSWTSRPCLVSQPVAEIMTCNVQIVNFASEAQQVDVEVLGLHSSPDMMTVHLLNNTNGLAENSFAEPYMVIPLQPSAASAYASFTILLCSWKMPASIL